MSIIHALLRWVLDVLAPGTGKRRAGCLTAVPAPAAPVPGGRPEASWPPPRTAAPWLPVHRSPYGLDVFLDGSASAVVRSYVIAHEHRDRGEQERRRVALVLAADFGVDLDRHVIGVEAVAV